MTFVPVIGFIYRKRLSKSPFIKKFSIRAKIKNLHSEGRGVPCWKCPRDTLLGPLWVAHRDQTVRRQSIAGRSSTVSPLSLSSGLEQSPCHYRSASAGGEVGWMLVLILMYLFSLKLIIPLFLIILLIFYFYLTWYDKFVLNFFFCLILVFTSTASECMLVVTTLTIGRAALEAAVSGRDRAGRRVGTVLDDGSC
jgi:hypothetical protein